MPSPASAGLAFVVDVSLRRGVEVLVSIVVLFFLAWLVGRVAERLARRVVDRSDARPGRRPDGRSTVSTLRQRETAVALIATSVRYLAFALAIVFSLVALSGPNRPAIVGASVVAVLIAFAAQRFLTDLVAGLLMFFEGWFRIGDTVAVDPWKAEGVVEAVSLRTLTLRTVRGEIVHIPNSQVLSLRVMPRGYREVEIEFFVSDRERGRDLVEQVARIVPVGPTRFLRRPELVEEETLDDDLYRIDARCAVAVGREWLAEDFLVSLIKERAGEGLLVHGPIATFVDDQALRSFARASRRTIPPTTTEKARSAATERLSPLKRIRRRSGESASRAD